MLFRICESQRVQEKTLTIAGYFLQKTESQTSCNFSGQIEFGLRSCCNFSGQIQFGLKSCCNFSGQTQFGLKSCSNISEFSEQNRFFAGFTQFFVPFFAPRQSLWIWHGYFEKKTDLACFLWQYRPLKQNSAAPQGSPPPTQQIKIQIQISWVGWSTI